MSLQDQIDKLKQVCTSSKTCIVLSFCENKLFSNCHYLDLCCKRWLSLCPALVAFRTPPPLVNKQRGCLGSDPVGILQILQYIVRHNREWSERVLRLLLNPKNSLLLYSPWWFCWCPHRAISENKWDVAVICEQSKLKLICHAVWAYLSLCRILTRSSSLAEGAARTAKPSYSFVFKDTYSMTPTGKWMRLWYWGLYMWQWIQLCNCSSPCLSAR